MRTVIFNSLKILVPVIILCACSARPARAQSIEQFISGNDLYGACSNPAQGFQNSCTGYIVGATDAFIQAGIISPSPNGNSKICIGTNIAIEQVVDVTKIYLEQHPATRQYSAASEVEVALGSSFPCQ